MPEKLMTGTAKLTIRVAAAGVGAVVAGPLGIALGAAFGEAIGGPLGKIVEGYVDKFGDKAAEKLIEAGGDGLGERIGKVEGGLEAAYREALRLSLISIRARAGNAYADWFENWDRCLSAGVALGLDKLQAKQLTQMDVESALQQTMVRIDAQGESLARRTPSLTLTERAMEEELVALLESWLPSAFDERFQALITSEAISRDGSRRSCGFRPWFQHLWFRLKSRRTCLSPDRN